MKNHSIMAISIVVVALACTFGGCTTEVSPGTVGRVNTPDGWSADILKTGRHTCFGRDSMYLLDVTNETFVESLNILVGGKVNLRVDFSVRARVNMDDMELVKTVFENVPATEGTDGVYRITVDQLYQTFLKMKVQAVPRGIYEVQPDVQTAIANSPQMVSEVRKQITEAAKSTPLVVEDTEITNYDWPESITKAQEELAQVQLREAAAAAQVRADLKRAEGQLLVAEADKLVELKKAETVAESIAIIKKTLAGAPEYLMWHQIRVMGEAAMGPNNAFILYPYTTSSNEVRDMMNNANLSQMLQAGKPASTTPTAQQ